MMSQSQYLGREVEMDPINEAISRSISHDESVGIEASIEDVLGALHDQGYDTACGYENDGRISVSAWRPGRYETEVSLMVTCAATIAAQAAEEKRMDEEDAMIEEEEGETPPHHLPDPRGRRGGVMTQSSKIHEIIQDNLRLSRERRELLRENSRLRGELEASRREERRRHDPRRSGQTQHGRNP